MGLVYHFFTFLSGLSDLFTERWSLGLSLILISLACALAAIDEKRKYRRNENRRSIGEDTLAEYNKRADIETYIKCGILGVLSAFFSLNYFLSEILKGGGDAIIAGAILTGEAVLTFIVVWKTIKNKKANNGESENEESFDDYARNGSIKPFNLDEKRMFRYRMEHFDEDKYLGDVTSALDAEEKALSEWKERYGEILCDGSRCTVSYDSGNDVWLVEGALRALEIEQSENDTAYIILRRVGGKILAVWH